MSNLPDPRPAFKVFPGQLEGGLLPSGAMRFIKGANQAGKTEFLLQSAIRAVLPSQEWCGLDLEGNQSFVMWIDNDIKFPLERFVHLLTQFVISRAKEAELAHRSDRSFRESLARRFTPAAVDDLLKSCLQRLFVITPVDYIQFRIALAALSQRTDALEQDCGLQDRPGRWLIIVDSLDAFFRTERIEKQQSTQAAAGAASASYQPATAEASPIGAPIEELLRSAVQFMPYAACLCSTSAKFRVPPQYYRFVIEIDPQSHKILYQGQPNAFQIDKLCGFSLTSV